jgi:hypothetical protein
MISVITWDASFRDYFHSVDYFCSQDYPRDKFEFIWVDFYNNQNPVLLEKIRKYPNARLLNLNNEASAKWHLGRCINEGVRQSSGEVLVIPDGDIVVDRDFLSYVWESHRHKDDLAMYFRRYDEPQDKSFERSREDFYHLTQTSRLDNATNYGGCLTLRRCNFEKIRGYETHFAFAGPGMIGFETYVRLKNLGLSIKWAKDRRIYHPWHENTLGAGFSEEKKNKMQILKWARGLYPWLRPAFIEQSWIVFSRELALSYEANEEECDAFLYSMPKIELLFFQALDDFTKSLKKNHK